ncbi:hypothetical protein F5146DRAFT_1228293 [Armillaria mellea]|nr:hypothetical protein F5146DRAFT_1228293 [Armillaria mellea]
MYIAEGKKEWLKADSGQKEKGTLPDCTTKRKRSRQRGCTERLEAAGKASQGMPRGTTLTNGSINGGLRNAGIAPANGGVYCGSRYKAFRAILNSMTESRFQMGETRQTNGSTTDARLYLSHIQMEIIKTISRIDAVALADANILQATRSGSEVLEVQSPLLRTIILKEMKATNRNQAEARDKTVWWDSNDIFAGPRAPREYRLGGETSYGCKEQRYKREPEFL